MDPAKKIAQTIDKTVASSRAVGAVASIDENARGQHHRMIAEAAYYLAQTHGLQDIDPDRDCLEAEVAINHRLKQRPPV